MCDFYPRFDVLPSGHNERLSFDRVRVSANGALIFHAMAIVAVLAVERGMPHGMFVKCERSTHRTLLLKSSPPFLKTDLCALILCITIETPCRVIAEAFVKMSKEVTIAGKPRSPEVPNERAGALCLVSKYWNAVAHNTPHLWTKINLFFPFADDHLDAARKRIRTSKFEKIDVSIDFCDPEWNSIERSYGKSGADQPVEAIWVHKILTLLRDTEERWEYIKVVSLTWLPLYKLIEG